MPSYGMDWSLSSVLRSSATKTAGIYLLFGIAWIGFTDWLSLYLTTAEAQLAWFQSIKEWLFIGLSTLFIFGLVSVRERKIRYATDRLNVALQQLQVIHRVFRHNLRNELTVFRGYLQMATSSIRDENVTDQLEVADQAAERIERLNEHLKIVENTHVGSQYVVDLVDVIEDEAARIQKEASRAIIDLDLPHEAKILGDDSLVLLVRELFRYFTVRQAKSAEAGRIEMALTKAKNQSTLSVTASNFRIPRSEIDPLRIDGEQPLLHASGVELWVIKWLANYYEGEVDIGVKDEHSEITVAFPEPPRWLQVEAIAQEQLDDLVNSSEYISGVSPGE